MVEEKTMHITVFTTQLCSFQTEIIPISTS